MKENTMQRSIFKILLMTLIITLFGTLLFATITSYAQDAEDDATVNTDDDTGDTVVDDTEVDYDEADTTDEDVDEEPVDDDTEGY